MGEDGLIGVSPALAAALSGDWWEPLFLIMIASSTAVFKIFRCNLVWVSTVCNANS